jgi:copper(I)-binding protein
MKKNHSILSTALAALFSLWACAVIAGESELAFDGAWVRAMPPGMKMTAGFGQLRNRGSADIEITAFASPHFGDVSLHRTELEDGVSRMREIPSLVISPGATIELEPGGYHLMLMGPVAALVPGQQVIIEMTAGDGQDFHFELPVERR